jgi:hypothetical protein
VTRAISQGKHFADGPKRLCAPDETGAALLLALIFLVVVGITVTALLTFTGNGLLDFSSDLNLQGQLSTASSATSVVAETVRYDDQTTGSISNSSGSPCPNFTNGVQPNGPGTSRYWVSCIAPSGGVAENGPNTRTIDFFACGQSGNCNATTNPRVAAELEFIDGSSCSSSALASCGQQQLVLSWVDAPS